MAKLSLSKALVESRAVASRDGKLIAAVALALFYLPAVIAGVVKPRSEGLPQSGGELALMALIAIVGVVGQLAVIRLALGGRASVGEAIGQGLRRAPAYVAASLIWLLPLIVVLIVTAGNALRAPETATLGRALGVLVVLGVMLFLSVRMLMSSSVAVGEAANPVEILRRSWALTAGHWWRLLGFLLGFLVVAVIALTAVGAVAGVASALLLGEPQPMSLAALLNAMLVELVTTLVTVAFVVMLARIYAQLAGPAHADVSVPSSGT